MYFSWTDWHINTLSHSLMELTPTPILAGTFAMLSGDLVGAFVDRLVGLVGERSSVIESLGLGSPTTTLLEAGLGVFFQVGLITAGTSMVTAAMPWVASDPASFSLFMIGLWSTSNHLRHNLDKLNAIVLAGGAHGVVVSGGGGAVVAPVVVVATPVPTSSKAPEPQAASP